MILLGLLLIIVAAGFTTAVFVQNSHPVDVRVLAHTFSTRPGWVVVAGIAALAVFVLGARLLALGIRRVRRRRSMLRDAENAAEERDQLAVQLATERERSALSDAPPEDTQQPTDVVASPRD